MGASGSLNISERAAARRCDERPLVNAVVLLFFEGIIFNEPDK